ncbi:MAG: GNAT family N-acetyltransferase [Acidobacteriota bacterium]
MPTLTPITPAHAALYKQARLLALADNPSAFGSTYARESQLTDADWLTRCNSLDNITRTAFLALEGEPPNQTPCGLVACFRDPADPTHAEVISMWVAPTHRRTGLSRRLLDTVREWAETQSITNLHLKVVSNNQPAIAFYHHYGFTFTGRSSPYPNDPRFYDLEMHLPLPAPRTP